MPVRGFHGHGTSPHLFYILFYISCVDSGVYFASGACVSFFLSSPFPVCSIPMSNRAQVRSPHPSPRSASTARSTQRQLGVSTLESLRAADLNRARLGIPCDQQGLHLLLCHFSPTVVPPRWIILSFPILRQVSRPSSSPHDFYGLQTRPPQISASSRAPPSWALGLILISTTNSPWLLWLEHPSVLSYPSPN
jgi:hypothetical protein